MTSISEQSGEHLSREQRFGAWLKAYMAHRGATARKIAAYAGVSHNAVNMWLQGIYLPRSESLTKLADTASPLS